MNNLISKIMKIRNMINQIGRLLLLFSLLLSVSCNTTPERGYFSIKGDITEIKADNSASTLSYSVRSNTEWKITNLTDQSWVKISPMKSSDNGTITITIDANKGKGRTATFVISPNGVGEKNLTITQGDTYIPSTSGEFPIIAWTGVDKENAAAQFQIMKEAGINTYLGWYKTNEDVLNMLDVAQANGIKMITCCTDSMEINPRGFVELIMNHPALYGYYVDDEPEITEFSPLAKKLNEVRAADAYHPSYINLYPNWAWGVDKYATNVENYVKTVDPPFISFDYYPIVSINGNPNTLRPDWYRNLEEISTIAKKYDKPFWGFALALGHTLNGNEIYRIPTLGELRLQVFSNLAYGAQAIQYFTFYGICRGTEKTAIFDYFKTVDTEVQALAGIFVGDSLISVNHTGTTIPNGTKKLETLPAHIKSLTTSDGGAIVSVLEKGNSQYLVIVNRDFLNPMDLNIDVDSSVSKVNSDGTIVAPSASSLKVEAGDMVIYTWKK
jgi:hypothetical protein